jgi:hypothetical protein
MADSKITDLTDGGSIQPTDEFVVARSGANNKIAGTALLTKLFDSKLGADAASIDTGAAGIASGYSALRILVYARSAAAANNDTLKVVLNADTGNNYYSGGNYGGNGSGTWTSNGIAYLTEGSVLIGDSRGANRFSVYELSLPDYAGSNYKALSGTGLSPRTTTETVSVAFGGIWLSTAAISRLAISALAGNLKAGSRLIIYGLP